jgi:hypothetical protein
LLKALVDSHPSKPQKGRQFLDVPPGDQEAINKNYILYLMRTLRFIFAVERNRKVKGIIN